MLKSESVRFIHDHYGNRGGRTIAYIRDGDSYRVGLAACSLRDNYDKTIGRRLARRRLEVAPITIPNLLKDDPAWTRKEVPYLLLALRALPIDTKAHFAAGKE